MAKMRNPISLPAGGASQANVDKSLSQATDEIKEVVYKSVAGLEVELNKTASATANGTLVVEPSDGKDVMEKATVTVAIPLEDNKAATIDVSQYASAVEVTPTDGKTAMKKTTVTLSNIPVLESNKTATIDASSYTEPVEITPTSGKDAMEKTTVTVSNIPVVESSKAATIDVSNYSDPVEIEPTDGKDAMAKTVVTLSNIPSGGDLEDNKTAAIDVSAYTDPVEVTPTQGKDGMKKVTVSLSNIPAGATMLYYWEGDGGYTYHYLNMNKAPATVDELKALVADNDDETFSIVTSLFEEGEIYTKVSDTEFTVSYEVGGQTITETFTRDATKDVEVWNAPPEVETTKQATIDVSTYDPANKPVITPTAGKQSMGEVEITLSNIPSGGSITVYEWDTQVPGETDSLCLGTFTETPTTSDLALVVGTDSDFNEYFASTQITQVGTEEKTWYEGGEEVTRTVPYIVCRSSGTDYKAYYFGRNIQF